MSEQIEGIKLIRHNAGHVDRPDDPSYPFKLEMTFSAPQFMAVAFVGLYGGMEEVVVRGKTVEALRRFIKINEFEKHPRRRKITITGPDGELPVDGGGDATT